MQLDLTIKLSKIILLFFIGIFGVLVFLGNILDYNSNYYFVKHVLSMDTVFPDNKLKYRAITSEFWHKIGYAFIITLEGIFGLLALIGAGQMLKGIIKQNYCYNRGKMVAIVGLMVGLAVWLFGFQVVGGEWFSMWQSKIWNGLGSADRMTTFIFLTLLYITSNNYPKSS